MTVEKKRILSSLLKQYKSSIDQSLTSVREGQWVQLDLNKLKKSISSHIYNSIYTNTKKQGIPGIVYVGDNGPDDKNKIWVSPNQYDFVSDTVQYLIPFDTVIKIVPQPKH